MVVFGTAAIVIPLFYRLKLSPMLGFILAGMLLGPFGLGALADSAPWLRHVTISDREAIGPVAELGVVLLLFMIGLELSFERLYGLRRYVFGLGGAKVAACSVAIATLAMAAGESVMAAVALGLALAQSSTAVIVQILSEDRKMTAPVGRASFSVLLFEDISIVVIIFGLTVLGARMGSGAIEADMLQLALTLGQALLAVAAVIGAGRLLLRPLFREVVRTRSPELFMTACLLVVIGTGLATALAGLSMALGALLAGLLLAETEYRRQIEVTIEPFKGLLLGVFLISVGMGIDLSLLFTAPVYVLGALLALVGVKTFISIGLVRAFGFSKSAALHAGLIMGPAGEFGFVTVGIAVTVGLFDPATGEMALLVTALSMILIPLLHILGKRLTTQPVSAAPQRVDLALPEHEDDKPRVILAGFGRVGEVVADMLDAHKIDYVAMDLDPDRVAALRKAGKPVYYGDISRADLLERLDLETARALVITMHDVQAANSLVEVARKARPDLLIVARARDAHHAAELYRLGASDTVPETTEASLQLSEAVLVDIGVPMGLVIASIHEKRDAFRARIQAMTPDRIIGQKLGRRLKDVQISGRDRSPEDEAG